MSNRSSKTSESGSVEESSGFMVPTKMKSAVKSRL